jgi:hypothetical protein
MKTGKDWRIIAPSKRSDNNTIRVILGCPPDMYAQ